MAEACQICTTAAAVACLTGDGDEERATREGCKLQESRRGSDNVLTTSRRLKSIQSSEASENKVLNLKFSSLFLL